LNERAIAHTLIEEPGFFVLRAHFEGNGEYARYHGAFFEPLEKSASDAGSSIGRRHGKKVQVCVVVSVPHNRKPNNVLANACHNYVDIGRANTPGYQHRPPTPSETVFN
jgi:hypothetical protein